MLSVDEEIKEYLNRLEWEKDIPYKKGQEVEPGSFVYDVVNYSRCPNTWTHLRIIRIEGNEIHEHDIPRGRKPEEVPREERIVGVYNQSTDPEGYKELGNFLASIGKAKVKTKL